MNKKSKNIFKFRMQNVCALETIGALRQQISTTFGFSILLG